mmetsp:Transcript_2005/g.5942  ORF Transcript_2005/g.5942 Transcript_2005/m.5942 type:complete len:595 (-) Transcript_2005:60-1844(-)
MSARLACRVARIVAELGTIQLRKWRNVRVEVRSKKIREAFVRLGPAFVKIGQALATRRDLLPAELCEELATLQDSMPATLSRQRAVEIIEADLRRPLRELFQEMPSQPVAAASLGQVYKARDIEGRVVAVKIQRDNVLESIRLDAVALKVIARGFGLALYRSRSASVYFGDIVDEVVGKVLEELDYRREARSARTFRKKFVEAEITCPLVVEGLSNERVLTTTWLEGEKLDVYAARQSRVERRRLVEAGVRCAVRQFFEVGFYHADPHPGNLLVTSDGKLGYLDFGKMGFLTPRDRFRLMTVLVHFVNRDAAGLARDFVELGCVLHESSDGVSEALVEEALRKTFSRKRERLSFAGVLSEVRSSLPTLSTSNAQDAFTFRVPARFAGIVRALGALEGSVLAVDPSFQVVAAAYPHVARALLDDADGRVALRQLLLHRDTGTVHWPRLRFFLGGGFPTSVSAEDDTTEKLLRRLGSDRVRRFVAELIDFLATDEGYRARHGLANDLDHALFWASSSEEDVLLSRVLRDFVAVVADEPAAYVPLILRAAALHHATLADLAARWTHRDRRWRTTERGLHLIADLLARVLPPTAGSSV